MIPAACKAADSEGAIKASVRKGDIFAGANGIRVSYASEVLTWVGTAIPLVFIATAAEFIRGGESGLNVPEVDVDLVGCDGIVLFPPQPENTRREASETCNGNFTCSHGMEALSFFIRFVLFLRPRG